MSLEWRGEPTRIALDSLRAAGVAGTIEGASAVIQSYERARARAVRAGVECLKKKVSEEGKESERLARLCNAGIYQQPSRPAATVMNSEALTLPC